MKIQISLKTSDHRGGHAADCTVALDINENITIKQLTEKVWKEVNYTDVIEIRLCKSIF